MPSWIPCFHKRELHRSDIHGRATIAEPLITGSNAQTRKLWCHECKTWTSYNRKRARDMVRRVVLDAIAYIRTSLRFENNHGSLTIRSAWYQQWNTGQAISWYSVGPIITLQVKLLQGSAWTGWVTRCIPWSRCYFRTRMEFSKKTMSPVTQLELFSRGLKSIKMKFSMFSGHHISRFEHNWIILVSFED
jgi:hypothetical protein